MNCTKCIYNMYKEEKKLSCTYKVHTEEYML